MSRALILLQALGLVLVPGVLSLAGGPLGDPMQLGIIIAVGGVSEMIALDVGAGKVKMSGGLLALTLAAVLLGPTAGAAAGAVTTLIAYLRWREPPHFFLNNLSTFVWFPLLGGLAFRGFTHGLRLTPASPPWLLGVMGTFVLMLALNFLGIVGYGCLRERRSLLNRVREAFAPMLAAEWFSAMLAMITTLLTVELGTSALLSAGVVLLVFQLLLGELVRSRHRRDELQRLSVTDELTELANRDAFRQRLGAEMVRRGSSQPLIVLLLNLDGFRGINDTLGHRYGDRLLGTLGARLGTAADPGELVARVAGDEFAFLLPGGGNGPARAEEILSFLGTPVEIEGISLEVTATAGLAGYPADGDDADTLLRRADAAMHAAKLTGDRVASYNDTLEQDAADRLTVLRGFRRALDEDELVVHLQPLVSLDGLQVRGAEALVRWQHPVRGLLQPGTFIDAVEKTGFIRPMTERVIDTALADRARLAERGLRLSISVNFSPRTLGDPSLVAMIERRLAAHGAEPRALKVEVTESTLMHNPEGVRANLMGLRSLGVKVSVDDFGTGHSSLAKLANLPIDELKIDRSFVSNMLTQTSNLIIVRSTINLAHDLGLCVVAEGVEDAATLQMLSQLGCDTAQGFHLSRPVPADQLLEWATTAQL